MDLTRGLTLYKVAEIEPLFDFDYPIFDEEYRPHLEQMVYDRYAFREIAIDDVAQWKHYFKHWFQTQMPYFNQRYISKLTDINPLITHHLEHSTKRRHHETNLKDYGSVLAEREQGSRRNSAKLDATVDTKTDQIDSNLTVNGKVEEMQDDKAGTVDRVTDGTREESEITGQVQDTSTDRSKRSTENTTSDRETDGESNRITNSVTDTTGTANKNHSDYPQGNVNTPGPNPGGWLTWAEGESSVGHSETDATEDITTHESQGFTQDVTGTETENTDTNVVTDTDRGLDRADHETMHQDTTDTEHRTTTTDADQQYDGTIDFTGNVTTDQSTSDFTKTGRDRDSTLTTAEAIANNKDQHDNEITTGFLGTSMSKLVNEWRSIMINPDEEVLTGLKPLFIGVY